MHLAAIVLAAGRSQRFGAHNKLLEDLAGFPVIARTVAAVAGARFHDIVVVTEQDHEAIKHALQAYPVRVHRVAPELVGVGYSIAVGAGVLSPDSAGVAILPGDMPLITASTLRTVAEAFVMAGGDRIVYAADATGAQRNPVIWPRSCFAALRALTGDRGAKSLIGDAIAVTVRDEREFLDVDTPEALENARAALGNPRAER
jgi:molybdenum cofactor cytidylyltransferase